MQIRPFPSPEAFIGHFCLPDRDRERSGRPGATDMPRRCHDDHPDVFRRPRKFTRTAADNHDDG